MDKVEIECIAFIPSAIFFCSYLRFPFSALCFLPGNFLPRELIYQAIWIEKEGCETGNFSHVEGKNLDVNAEAEFQFDRLTMSVSLSFAFDHNPRVTFRGISRVNVFLLQICDNNYVLYYFNIWVNNFLLLSTICVI